MSSSSKSQTVIKPIPVKRYVPVAGSSVHSVPQGLIDRLKVLGRRYMRIHSARWMVLFGIIALCLISSQMFLDWLLELAFPVRALFLVAELVWLGFGIYTYVLPLFLRPLKVEACALLVEKKWPFLRGRVIASIQMGGARFTRDSPELIEALHQQTEALTMPLKFSDVVSARPPIKLSRWLLAMSTIWIVLMVANLPGSLALLERVFLLPAPVPRKTQVICLSGSKTIAIGDSFMIEAQARGVIPPDGRVTMTDDSGQIQEVNLDSEGGDLGRFKLRVERIEQPFNYVIHLNDGTSDTFRVTTAPSPGITSMDCVQTFPAYTGQGKIKRSLGNLALLVGSTLDIHATVSCSVSQARMKLIGLDQVQPMVIGGAQHNEITGTIQIPATKLEGFSIKLTSDSGISSGEEAQYRIDLIPDRPPVIQITFPQQMQELVTSKTNPTIAFAASDDYGLAKIVIKYRIVSAINHPVGGTDAEPPTEMIEMQLPETLSRSIKAHYVWNLPEMPTETTLEYWMEAEDNNNVTGPGVGVSERHTIKIVTDQEKKDEIFRRLVDTLNTVSDLSQSQEKVNQDLGQAIQGK